MPRKKTNNPRIADWEPTADVARMAPAQIIKERHEAFGMQQGELARRLDYDNANFISMIVSGWAKVPLAKAPLIADVLRLPPRWFVERVYWTHADTGDGGLYGWLFGADGELREDYERDLKRAQREWARLPGI
jgi:hypothetical protein